MIIRSDNYITNPVVACGIIVYNQKDFIAQCIDGMLNQVCDFPYNIVIADDGSTDGTQDILREYQSRYPEKIKLVLNEQNGGIAANWVSGCKEFEGGEFVSFCDGDDYWSNPKKLQLQVDYLRAHPECVAVSSDYDNMNEDGSDYIACYRSKRPPLTGYVQEDLWSSGKAQNAWCTFMFSKKVFDEHMPLQGFIEHNFPFQDWPALVVISAYGTFDYMPISTCVVRRVKGSDSNAIDIGKTLRRQERSRTMNKYLASLFPNLKQDTDDVFDRYIALTMISVCIRNSDYQQAKAYAIKSGRKNLRYWCCQTKWTFWAFRTAKLVKQKLSALKRKLNISK